MKVRLASEHQLKANPAARKSFARVSTSLITLEGHRHQQFNLYGDEDDEDDSDMIVVKTVQGGDNPLGYSYAQKDQEYAPNMVRITGE